MPRSWTASTAYGFHPVGLFIGKGTSAIEVAVARSSTRPTRTALTDSWKARRAGRATPVLLVVLYGSEAALCGPSGEKPLVHLKTQVRQVERLCREALQQPDRHAALRFLTQALPSLETALPGLSNAGLLALHELQYGAPKRADWADAGRKATHVVGQQGKDLLAALGFQIERLDNLTSLLRSEDRRTALAVLLRDTESPVAGTERFNSLSPVSYALAKADLENLPWVILVQGNRLRLYSTSMDTGVGRRGRTETFIECQPSLLSANNLAYVWLLYSAEALAPNASLSELLADSQRFAGGLADQLRERIYDKVVPVLAQGIAAARNLNKRTTDELERTYQMALTVLFRLLFIAYAEDRDLLPYRFNDAYRRRSLKQKALELAQYVAENKPITDGSNHWQETKMLWQAVADGNQEWAVPAYDGGLFSDDADVSRIGAELDKVHLPNSTFEAALRALLVVDTVEGVPGAVDFRSLGIREFGTIYEGLLESELALADTDLALKKQKGNLVYVPARSSDDIAVQNGEVYLHNRSGVRKSSGSYYTKHFAVEHLLDGALEPALDDHFARLSKLDDTDASDAFFDFRVADIAMGSGHFLIAAIDRVEKGMADFLVRRDLPGVRVQLSRLREAAKSELGDLAETVSIEDGQLLRRMIARHCVYGVDLNALSVQLARLAVWIHTFVPGLPLSVLDHNLVRGNSLVGIGTVEEIRQRFEETGRPLFPVDANSLLGQAAKSLNRLANINDESLKDVEETRKAIYEVSAAVADTKELCDLIVAAAITENQALAEFSFEYWEPGKSDPKTKKATKAAREELKDLCPLHFPVAFPEVFLRKRPGFDVILGNPPWQEATVEEHAFWARHFPGLRGATQKQQEALKNQLREDRRDLVEAYEAEREEMDRVRKALVSSSYPGMGTGDPDLYKAFCWRFWHLSAAQYGYIGVVLPRGALMAKGSTKFRETAFQDATRVEVHMLINRKSWVFDNVHQQYFIALVCIARDDSPDRQLRLQGPFDSIQAFEQGKASQPVSFSSTEVLAWNDTVSLPLLPSEESVEVFAQLRCAPRLDLNEPGKWRARPDAELHATHAKYLMDLVSETCPQGYWPVYKGKSFDVWNPDTGVYYAWAEPTRVQEYIMSKRQKAPRRSAHAEFSLAHRGNRNTLPCLAPRIAFRDISNSVDRRTVTACLIPPQVFVTNKGPYFLWPRGDEKDQAFLLGVLSSICLDWYARRFVKTNLNFFILNPFPVPRPSRDDLTWKQVVSIAARLACPDERFAQWADSAGVAYGPIQPDEKKEMMYQLDALIAHLYGINERQLIHIFETHRKGWDYQGSLDGVLRYYRDWARKR